MKKWHQLLTGVLEEFIKTKSGVANDKFWQKICHFSSGNGTSSISVWISVFAMFNKYGEWQGDRRFFASFGGVKIEWPVVEIAEIPSGAISVPIHIDGNGTEYDGCLMAGQFAFDGEGTSVQPRSDWCIAVKSSITVKA